MKTVINYLINPLIAAFVGFIAGKFLLPFVLYNKVAMKAITGSAEKKSAKDQMPVEVHVMRSVRDVDHLGAGIAAALVIWGFAVLRHEDLTFSIGLLGFVVVALLSSRLGFMNLGRTRNVTIASVSYWVAWVVIAVLR